MAARPSPHADGRDPQTSAIIGAAIEVHKQLGGGFLETVYAEALAVELAERSVPYAREVPLKISYKGVPLTATYRADFVCFDSIVVELKAQHQLTNIDEAQVINYLRATGLQRALLFNFAGAKLQQKRVVLGWQQNPR